MKRKVLLFSILALLLLATLSLVAFAEDESAGHIQGHNLNITDHVDIIYYVTFDGDPADYDESGVLVFTSEKEAYTYDTADAILDGEGDDPVVTARATYHKFYYVELADYQMTDILYARAYAVIGGEIYYSKLDTYSVLQYAMEQTGKTGCDPNPRLAGILEWLLSEGAAAQIEANYHTERLANGTYGFLSVEGGTLPDGLLGGCYAIGDEVTMTGLGGTIGWYNEANEYIYEGATMTVTVTAEPQFYRAVCKAHNFVEELASAATCTDPAVYRLVCACGVQSGEPYSVGEALGHIAVVDPAVAATCTETGLTAGTHCSRCGAVLVAQEVLPALGHVEVIDAAVAPTCTETGLTAGSHCSACGTVLIAQEVVSATGHIAVTDAAVAATCTETGLSAGSHCSRCDAVLIAQEVLPALGHAEVVDPAVSATCTETGLTAGSHCSVCGTVLTAQEVVPALGHNITPETGYCSRCGEGNVIYVSNGDGTCRVTGLVSSDVQFAVIAATSFAGDTVTSIAANAFANATIEEIVLPSTLQSLGQNALRNLPLMAIYYTGNQAHWESFIENGNVGAGNEILSSADVYFYTANKPQANGSFWHWVNGVITLWPPEEDNYGPLVPMH